MGAYQEANGGTVFCSVNLGSYHLDEAPSNLPKLPLKIADVNVLFPNDLCAAGKRSPGVAASDLVVIPQYDLGSLECHQNAPRIAFATRTGGSENGEFAGLHSHFTVFQSGCSRSRLTPLAHVRLMNLARSSCVFKDCPAVRCSCSSLMDG